MAGEEVENVDLTIAIECRRRFYTEPSAETFIAWMRAPGAAQTIEVEKFPGSFDFSDSFGLQRDIKEAGLKSASALFTTQSGVRDEYVLDILEAIIRRDALVASGETALTYNRKAIPNWLIDTLIVAVLEQLYKRSEPPSAPIVMLVREHLSGKNPIFRRRTARRKLRYRALELGAQLSTPTRFASISEVARALDMEASTILRLFGKGQFEAALTKYIADRSD